MFSTRTFGEDISSSIRKFQIARLRYPQATRRRSCHPSGHGSTAISTRFSLRYRQVVAAVNTYTEISDPTISGLTSKGFSDRTPAFESRILYQGVAEVPDTDKDSEKFCFMPG
jgi:hypothetical protein